MDTLTAKINKAPRLDYHISLQKNGDVRFEAFDFTPFLKTFFGASDHEHVVTVKQAEKDKLLVTLLRDRFLPVKPLEHESEYTEWLKAQQIEPDVFCWMS